MSLFSKVSLAKGRGATVAAIFGVALSSILLLCGAGSVPVENFLPQGAMQGDLNAGGHDLTNAGTISTVNLVVNGTNVASGVAAASNGVSYNAGTQTVSGVNGTTTNVGVVEIGNASTNAAPGAGSTAYDAAGSAAAAQAGAEAFSSNATNITSGTLAAARVPTLNQNTTGSAGSVALATITGAGSNVLADGANATDSPSGFATQSGSDARYGMTGQRGDFQRVRIILDSDAAGDSDDFAAIALAGTLQRRGECELLGVVTDLGNASSTSPASPIAVKDELLWGGMGNVPVGFFTSSTVTNASGNDAVAICLAESNTFFPAGINSSYFQSSVALYRKLLTSVPDITVPGGGVTIVGTGASSALYYLDVSPADSISPLTGAQLIARKVNKIVQMGANFTTNGVEYNMSLDPASDAVYSMISSAGTPVYWYDYPLGCAYTFNSLSTCVPGSPLWVVNLPVGYTAYDEYALYFAVRGLQYGGASTGSAHVYFNTPTPGSASINLTTGAASWSSTPTGQYYMRFATGGQAELVSDVAILLNQSPMAGPPANAGAFSYVPTATTTVSGSTSGSVTFTMYGTAGPGLKQVVMTFNNLVGSASYTYPFSMNAATTYYTCNGGTVSTSVLGAGYPWTSNVTVNGAASPGTSGVLVIQGN